MHENVVVIPGLLENRRHAKKLLAELAKHHMHARVDESNQPKIRPNDIVITHSGGLWLLGARAADAKIIFAIAPPNAGQSMRHVARSLFIKEARQLRANPLGSVLRARINTLCSLLQPGRQIELYKRYKNSSPRGSHIHYIYPTNDPFAPPKDQVEVSIGTNHDDLYYDPKPYVNYIVQTLTASGK